MKQIITIVLVSIFFFSGCSTITYDGRLFENLASMNKGNLAGEYSVVGKFKYESKAVFVVYDLITVKDPALDNEMQKTIKINDGDAIINIRIKEVTNIVDILLGALVSTVTQAVFKTSIDIVSTRTVEIEGDVVKYNSTSLVLPNPESQLLIAVDTFNR